MVGPDKPAMYMYIHIYIHVYTHVHPNLAYMNRVVCQTGYVYSGPRELTSSIYMYIYMYVQGSLGLLAYL